MELYQIVDNKIQEGYLLLLEKKDEALCCDRWLDAWDGVKRLFSESGAKDIYELDKKYNWSQYISNYAQDLEMELHNAGIRDAGYHLKRAAYCRELLEWCGPGELIISNARRGMAEGYFNSGDAQTCDRLYTEWLRDDPDWGWGYIGWADCYRFSSAKKQYRKAEQILLDGYNRKNVRDRISIVECLCDLYEESGVPDKAEEYKRIFAELRRNEPVSSPYYIQTPIRSGKAGRNDPCPCGSGKKYKKCCGA